jgi:hypothetical protein
MQVKRAKANINFVMVTASREVAGQLQGRLQWVNSWWDCLQERLKRRKIQLTFEKAEKVNQIIFLYFFAIFWARNFMYNNIIFIHIKRALYNCYVRVVILHKTKFLTTKNS